MYSHLFYMPVGLPTKSPFGLPPFGLLIPFLLFACRPTYSNTLTSPAFDQCVCVCRERETPRSGGIAVVSTVHNFCKESNLAHAKGPPYARSTKKAH